MGDFFNTLYGKLIAVLTIIALVMGIGMEGISIWRNVAETHTATQVAVNSTVRQDADTKRAKAEECSARMKTMIEITPPREIGGEAYQALQRECNPDYAAKVENCDNQFNAIMQVVNGLNNQIDMKKEYNNIRQRMDVYKEKCPRYDELTDLMAVKYKELLGFR